MHTKHRNGPGNMYRSNSIGIGGVAAARISPESSVRGPRMYGAENRAYGRDGYGRAGRPKHLQPPQEVDVFKEAGKLAAEYLVSRGVLPPSALSGKWPSEALKNQEGNFQEFRQQQADRIQSPANGRASVHSRLGNAAIEVGLGRRKYSDEYSLLDSRNSGRVRRRAGLFKNYMTETNKESGRSESWAEKSRASPGKEVDSDASVGHNGDQLVEKDDNSQVQNLSPCEVTKEVVSEVHTAPATEKCGLVENADANNSTLSKEKVLLSGTEGECPKKPDDADKFKDAAESVDEKGNNDALNQKDEMSKEVQSSSRDDISVREDHNDLVKRCKFVNVPTKTRSSLMNKGSKGGLDPVIVEVNASKKELSESSETRTLDNDIGSSRGNASSQENQELKPIQSDMVNSLPTAKELDISKNLNPGLCLRSGSSVEILQCKEEEPEEQLSELQRSNPMFMERDGKRAVDFDSDDKKDFKKFRQWFPTPDAESDGSLLVYSSTEEQSCVQDAKTLQSAHCNLSPDQKSLDNSMFPRGQAEPGEFMEEKQLFPGSFKTCDLNLDGTSDVTEQRDTETMFLFPSVTQAGKVGSSVGIDLSMSNNCSPNKDNKHSVGANDIEVIDLDSDSAQENKAFSNPERRGDVVFADLDGFSNNVHNANAIPDVQDGYGLMISELLANGSPTCTSVHTDLNSLNNPMGLSNTEGMLADDDSIYMSLGEIPISLLGHWEQPTQDYGKPF
ncbi:uncharacterized protein At4g26450-like [Andrographis paniculata]|uniref:uncharacterized protein At4g26450-like n=1 Tax=Andrographis paniculata TaxID=175694 RepID=UPI0021E891F7|nr:uncharacterized protein At4g26450-like [Andrographis paniculata]